MSLERLYETFSSAANNDADEDLIDNGEDDDDIYGADSYVSKMRNDSLLDEEDDEKVLSKRKISKVTNKTKETPSDDFFTADDFFNSTANVDDDENVYAKQASSCAKMIPK